RQPDGAASREKAHRLVAAALDGVPQQFEWRHRQLGGTEFDVEVKLNRFIVSGTPFLVAVVRDITERQRAQLELRHQHLADELINRVLGRCAIGAPSEFDAQMVSSLRELADFIGVDHAYFFMTSPEGASYSCTHESCGPGVEPLRAKYQKVPIGTNA